MSIAADTASPLRSNLQSPAVKPPTSPTAVVAISPHRTIDDKASNRSTTHHSSSHPPQ
jgi:hypothetical protein